MSRASAAKAKFNVAGYRHQLLTPLNHVIGHAELLLDELPEGGYSSLYQDLKRIRETARGLVRLIHTRLVPNPGKVWSKVLEDLRFEMTAPLHTILQAVGAITSEHRNDLNVADVLQIGRSTAELLSFAQGQAISDGTGEIRAAAHRAKKKSPSHAARILIVDDNRTSRELLARQLKRQGYRIAEAASGTEALAMLLQSSHDAVLLDLLMPKLDGFQVLERIKADPAMAQIPVIVLSALDELPGVVRSIEIGAEDYIFKPFDPVLLSARIHSSLEKKRLIDLERQRASEAWQRGIELEKANQQLHVSEQRLRLALSADQACIWDWDLHDRFTRFAAQGREPKAGTLDDLLATMHPDDRERIRAGLFASAAAQTNYQDECRMIDEDGRQQWFAVTGALEYDAGQPVCMIGVGRDITQQREVELALRRSNQDFERFAMAASHDLREPLRAVGADLRSLLEMNPQGRELIVSALDRLDSMSKLITDLLDYSDVGSKGALQPSPVEAVLTGVLSDLRMIIEASGATISHDELPTVRGDFMMLHRLFQNLISNAIKYRCPAPPRIHISAQRIDGFWKFSVADNGVGVPSRHLESIFEPFQRLHNREVPGRGLGLSICRRILEHLDGKIWVESEAGKGSTFFFTLPAS